jgi:predicted Zn-ribbon and HTH transcriptional regulator
MFNSWKRLPKIEFVCRLKQIKGPEYELISGYVYTGSIILVRHSCGYKWKIKAGYLINKWSRCPNCFGKNGRQKTTKTFAREIRLLDKDYELLGAYVSATRAVEIKHKKCGLIWKVRPTNFLTGTRCPKCSGRHYSAVALKWLNWIENKHRIKIQHAANGGEFVIPGTKYRVDGYCKETNTVYEFYGDKFHGNPKVFKASDKPNPYSKKTAKELLEQTNRRKRRIRSLGYKIRTIWESNWIKRNSHA